MYVYVKWNGFGPKFARRRSEIRAWFVDTNPTGGLISVHHYSPNALADPRKPLACSRHYA